MEIKPDMISKSTSSLGQSLEQTTTKDFNFPQFQHQFSQSLFLNEDERKLFNEDFSSMKNILEQRQDQYDKDYYNYFTKKKKWIEEELEKGVKQQPNEIQELRSNIRVLIIIGSKLKYTKKVDQNRFLSGYEDLSTALFLRNIFHYCYGIDYTQIIITSLKRKDFSVDKNISSKKSYETIHNFFQKTREINEKFEKMGEFDNEIAITKTHNKLIYTQIGKDDMVFISDEDIDSIILPFNRKVLSSLNTNENSELFVFFVNHGVTEGFDDAKYEYFLERFNEMKFSHATIINEASYSGMIVKIFKSCERFEHFIQLPFNFKITKAKDSDMDFYTTIQEVIDKFSSNEQKQIQIILYNVFLKYNQWPSIKNKSVQNTTAPIENLSFYFGFLLSQFGNINVSVQNICEAIILGVINSQLFHQKDEKQAEFNAVFIEFTNSFENNSPSEILFIDPEIVNSLKNRIVILSSCNLTEKAYSLPLRKKLYFPHKAIQIYGTIYMSAVINCLLYPSKFVDFTSKGFVYSINKEFQHLKKDFYEVILDQNKPKNPTDEDIKNIQKIEEFFKDGNTPPSYIKFDTMIPFSKLILPDRFWFFDRKQVNVQEYEDLKTKNYISRGVSPKSKEYGPVDGKGKYEKLKEDFIKCFNKNIESMKIEGVEPFRYEKLEDENYSEIVLGYYCKIYNSVQRFIKWRFQCALLWHEPYIKAYLQRNTNHIEELSDCFIKTFEAIIPFWKGILFDYY